MKHIFFSILFFLFALIVNAQITIKGRVVNEENNEPVSGASVYINSTTIGTTTNGNGEFVITTSRQGFAELIISSIGYEFLVHKIELGIKDFKFLFRIKPKVEEMRNVLVLSPSMRQKWLKTFRENFLGITPAAEQCKIENEEEILFEKGLKNGEMIAFSDVPLIITNKEFGYKIHFQLIEFYYNPDERRTFFIGFSRFENLKDKVTNRWEKNRKDYYYGSTAHFFDALIKNNLEEEDFSIRLLQKLEEDSTNIKKDSLKLASDGSVTIKSSQQKPMLSLPVSVESILKKNSDTANTYYTLNFKGRLQVLYKKEPKFKNALRKKIIISGHVSNGVVSYIDLLEAPALLDAMGNFENPLAIQLSGFWEYEKLGNMLPLDYKPN